MKLAGYDLMDFAAIIAGTQTSDYETKRIVLLKDFENEVQSGEYPSSCEID